LAEVRSFRKSVGGTATNVAVAAARLGHRSAVFTKVGDDPFGHYVKGVLAATFGVDTSYVGMHPTLRTPLAFAELLDPGDPRIVFYREPMAPEMTITPDEIDAQVVSEVPILWVPAGALAGEPSRGTIGVLMAGRGRREHTIVDLDWRPVLWGGDSSRARQAIAEVLPFATMAIGNRAECELAVGTTDPYDAADRLLALGVGAAVVKMGGEGVLVATADGVRERVSPYVVQVVCGLGAGDAFGGALCHGLLSGWDLVACARAGNAAGAIVASRLMCADDMPTAQEIEEMLHAAH
jgi:5-dehydro-2-deoxygluconokinase